MDDSKWERNAAAAGGVLFVILLLVAAFIQGTPPALDDPVKKFAKFFVDKNDEIRIATYLSCLAVVPILLWLGSLWRRLRAAEGDDPRLTVAAAAGLVFSGALVTVGGAVIGYAAIEVDSGSLAPESAKTLYQLSMTLTAAGSFGVAVLVGAVGGLSIRTGVFPKWFGWASCALAAGWLVGGAGVADNSDTFAAIGFIVFLLWLVWVLVVTYFLARPREAAAT